jgi:hypothetical protein
VTADEEVVEGYIVDVACLRTWPCEDVAALSREHSRACALMGHCVESGYGLVDPHGWIRLLDPAATTQVVAVVAASSREKGIRLRVRRRRDGAAMRTVDVEPLGDAHGDVLDGVGQRELSRELTAEAAGLSARPKQEDGEP